MVAISGGVRSWEGWIRMIFGYLDAGSGSLILQAILGGAAGILVAFKAWKARLMGKRAVADSSDVESGSDEQTVATES